MYTRSSNSVVAGRPATAWSADGIDNPPFAGHEGSHGAAVQRLGTKQLLVEGNPVDDPKGIVDLLRALEAFWGYLVGLYGPWGTLAV